MAFKTNRTLKVYKQGGYRYKPTPTITLKGKWCKAYLCRNCCTDN